MICVAVNNWKELLGFVFLLVFFTFFAVLFLQQLNNNEEYQRII